MGLGRFVEFGEGSERPTLQVVRDYVVSFLGGLGKFEEIPWLPAEGRPMWHVTIPGSFSNPERELPDEQPARWIEVWPHGPIDALDAVNVETRAMDPLTSAIANGLAASMARKWRATVDDGGAPAQFLRPAATPSPDGQEAPRPDMPLGLYRHTKGDLYVVLGLAQDSTNGAADPYGWMVHYRSLRPPPGRAGVYVRRYAQFVESVRCPDGKVRPRFEALHRFESLPVSTDRTHEFAYPAEYHGEYPWVASRYVAQDVDQAVAQGVDRKEKP